MKTAPKTIAAGTELFIVMAARDVQGYAYESDRVYFSKPVRVVVLEGAGDMFRVRDNLRGHEYPCLRSSLYHPSRLSAKQRAAVAAADAQALAV